MIESPRETSSEVNPYASPHVELHPVIRPVAARSTELFLLGVLTSFCLLIAAINSRWAGVWLVLIFIHLSALRSWAWSRWESVQGFPLNYRRRWELFGNSLVTVALIILAGLAAFLILFGIVAFYAEPIPLPDGTLARPTDILVISAFVLVMFLLKRSWPAHLEARAVRSRSALI